MFQDNDIHKEVAEHLRRVEIARDTGSGFIGAYNSEKPLRIDYGLTLIDENTPIVMGYHEEYPDAFPPFPILDNIELYGLTNIENYDKVVVIEVNDTLDFDAAKRFFEGRTILYDGTDTFPSLLSVDDFVYCHIPSYGYIYRWKHEMDEKQKKRVAATALRYPVEILFAHYRNAVPALYTRVSDNIADYLDEVENISSIITGGAFKLDPVLVGGRRTFLLEVLPIADLREDPVCAPYMKAIDALSACACILEYLCENELREWRHGDWEKRWENKQADFDDALRRSSASVMFQAYLQGVPIKDLLA